MADDEGISIGAIGASEDVATGDKLYDKSTHNAKHVAINGAITSVSGTMKSWTLDGIATDLTNIATDTTSFIEYSGIKGFIVENYDVIDAGHAMLIGWSSVANDSASVASALNAFNADIGTPDGTAHANVIALSNGTKDVPSVLWDGTTTIKTIGIRVTASAGAADAVVRTVE